VRPLKQAFLFFCFFFWIWGKQNMNPDTLPEKPKPKTRNQFTAVNPYAVQEIKKAHVRILLDQGKTYNEINQITGCAPATISAIKKGHGDINYDMAEALKRSEVSRLTVGVAQILDGTLTDEKIASASLQQGVTSAAILIDKRELLSGKPTQIVDVRSDPELDQKILSLEATLGESGEVYGVPEPEHGTPHGTHEPD